MVVFVQVGDVWLAREVDKREWKLPGSSRLFSQLQTGERKYHRFSVS